jgi:hypothetical protein
MQGDNQELNALKWEICFNWRNIEAKESPHEMLQSTHLYKLEAPLSRLLLFSIAPINLTNYLQWVEKLVNWLGVEKFVPNLLIFIHTLHPGELFNLLEQFFINRQFLKEIPSGLNQMRFAIFSK